MRLFIYELISAGALGPATPAALHREGWAMLSAIVEDFSNIPGLETITMLDSCCSERPRWKYRSVQPMDEADVFCELARSADLALIIAPEFDDHLALRSDYALDAGCRLLGCAPGAVRLTGDKLQTADWLAKRGIATPPTQLLDVWEPTNLTGLRVCKPRYGAGSQSMCLLHGPYEIPRPWTPDMIEQPYVPGQPVSVAFLVGPKQIVPTPGATQHLADDGRFHYLGGRTPLPPPLRDRAIPLAQRAVEAVPGLQGYVGVDLILGAAADGSHDVVVEINPRLTTSYIGLRQLTRTNLAELWLRLWRGETVEQPDWSEDVIEFTADGTTLLAASRSQ